MIRLRCQRWPRVFWNLASSPFRLLLLTTVVITLTSALSVDRVIVWLIGVFTGIGCLAINAIADEAKGVAVDWRPQWSMRGMLASILCFAVILACLLHQTPFQVRFTLAREAIDSLAERAVQGERVETPCWAGTFLVRQIEVFPMPEQPAGDRMLPADSAPLVYVWTELDSVGRAGFARGIAANNTRYWEQRRLDDRWWFVVED